MTYAESNSVFHVIAVRQKRCISVHNELPDIMKGNET